MSKGYSFITDYRCKDIIDKGTYVRFLAPVYGNKGKSFT